MNKYNEKEVIALLQEPSRQREAFERIVNEYSEQLYWQIRHMVLSHDDANDILQNTFLKAWLNIGYFRAEAKMSTWLYRIALNECLTFLNREKANNHTSIDDADTEKLNQLEGDIYFDGNEGQKALLRAINKLPEKQRIIFNLKYFKEMKYDEISEILGTSIGALKASYHHAVKKIEAFLEKHL
ncbi:MAG: RNA polymerase sigma factor [Bacteroidaceae bacterium]|nr:RNA polymerase sigma factor [Bacteroidaceae bacterium]